MTVPAFLFLAITVLVTVVAKGTTTLLMMMRTSGNENTLAAAAVVRAAGSKRGAAVDVDILRCCCHRCGSLLRLHDAAFELLPHAIVFCDDGPFCKQTHRSFANTLCRGVVLFFHVPANSIIPSGRLYAGRMKSEYFCDVGACTCTHHDTMSGFPSK